MRLICLLLLRKRLKNLLLVEAAVKKPLRLLLQKRKQSNIDGSFDHEIRKDGRVVILFYFAAGQ